MLTVKGRQLHERADSGRNDRRDGVRAVRSLPLRSLHWGLIGKADVVEFHDDPGRASPRCFPVEYKRGKPKPHDADRVQLCAQAMCLEEMLGRPVAGGALFYGKTRRRVGVDFDAGLRATTESTIGRLRDMIDSRVTPPAVYEKAKCERCSLVNLCLPGTSVRRSGAAAYLEREARLVGGGAGPTT